MWVLFLAALRDPARCAWAPEQHDRLQAVEFHARESMHSLLVEGVDLMLTKHRG